MSEDKHTDFDETAFSEESTVPAWEVPLYEKLVDDDNCATAE